MGVEDSNMFKRPRSEIQRINSSAQLNLDALDQLTNDMGLIEAGEFRSGNGVTPGLGFSGIRIGYPGFRYENESWNIVGVNQDALQFGLRADDGVALWGAGAGRMEANGMFLEAKLTSFGNNPTSIIWQDASSQEVIRLQGVLNPSQTANGRITVNQLGEMLSGILSLTSHGDDPEDMALIALSGSSEPIIVFSINKSGEEIKSLLSILYNEVVINEESSSGTNFRVAGSEKSKLLFTDAANNEVQFDGRLKLVKAVISIFAGELIYKNCFQSVGAESGAADELDTIIGGGVGSILILAAQSGDTITVRDGVGNIQLANNQNKVLSGNKMLSLLFNGAVWVQVAYANN
ncbi:MAG: hypothetical protein OEY93_04800 [Anaerolineae bacterium]|nr:hypothetical protein [Anaerolineae bacterium]